MVNMKFKGQNYIVKQAVEDADELIIQIAINMTSSFMRVFVVREV